MVMSGNGFAVGDLLFAPEDGLAGATDAPMDTMGGFTGQEMEAPRPVISELDRWALKNHKVYADRLDDEQLDDLASHVLSLAERDKTLWGDRNTRMLKEQERVDLKLPSDGRRFTMSPKTEADEAEDSEAVLLPDPFLYVSKVVDAIARAGFTFDVPQRGPETAVSAQRVEAFLDWWMAKWKQRHIRALGGDPIREMVYDGCVRGWQCGLLMPNVADTSFPWTARLPDPMDVYPRHTQERLVRVTHQFQCSALDARADYPEAEEALADKNEEDEVEVVGYYDEIYHAILIKGTNLRRLFVKPPVAHEVVDIDGTPIVPWVITLPVPNRRSRDASGKPDTANIGISLLFGIDEMYLLLCKIVSELASNVARSADQPTIRYIDPANPNTQPISLAAGARNYAVYDREKIEVLDLAPNPGNLQPLVQVVSDRLNKLTLPSVAWGDAGSVTSGYGVNLLRESAEGKIAPYAQGTETFQAQFLTRVLESYVFMAMRQWIGPIDITTRSPLSDRRMGALFDPADIMKVGTDVEVKVGTVMPQDEAALSASMIQLTAAGLYSRHTARKKLGMRDPLVETRWQALEAFLQSDPQLAVLYAQKVAEMSDDDFLQMIGALNEQQKAAAAALMQQAGGSPGVAPTSAVPLERQIGPGGRAGQAPSRENPADQQQRAMNDMIARLSGGSLPG